MMSSGHSTTIFKNQDQEEFKKDMAKASHALPPEIPEEEREEKQLLSDQVLEYLKQHFEALRYEKQAKISPIQVDELASKVAKLYEKVRRVIDWKEEHLVRRTAIERILKRRLISELYGMGLTPKMNAREMAEPMVMELIRSGYFPNGEIPKDKVVLARKVLEKYIYILDNNPVTSRTSLDIKKKTNFYNNLIEIAACEIEEILAPAYRENALMNLMTNIVYDRIKIIPENYLCEEEAFIQIYIAVHRTLFNLDAPVIIFNLIKMKYPIWFSNDEADIKQITISIAGILKDIENDLEHPKGGSFYRVCAHYDAAYRILGDLMKKIEGSVKDMKQRLLDESILEKQIERAYGKRYVTLKRRLIRSAIFSTLSILLSGIVSFLIFEGPVAKLVHGHFSPWALVVDLAVPTILMFLFVIVIKPPHKKNYQKVVKEVQKTLFRLETPDVYEVSLVKKKKTAFTLIFGAISMIAGAASLIFIWWIFKLGGVPWTSLYIDTATVAMIVFAAMVIRDRSKEITIEDRGSFSEFLLDLFTIPLAKLGQWLSEKWKEYNIVSVLFTALIDAPFSAIIAVIEDWRSFLKERRSEIH